jgi:hypothetical protein
MTHAQRQTWSPEVIRLGEAIASLTNSQAAELLEYLRDSYQIEPPEVWDFEPRPIPKNWLCRRLAPDDSDYAYAAERLHKVMRRGDELWSYDEPMPPDVLAGELGVALVRHGVPIHAVMTGVH